MIALQKRTSMIFILIGIIIIILALSVDFIGLGVYRGYGYKQISGIVVGVIAIFIGDHLRLKE